MKEKMKVMIGYDGSSYADAAINDLCRAGLPPESEILIVSVMDLSVISPPISEFDLHSLASRRALMVMGRAKAFKEREFEKVKTYAVKAAERLRSCFPGAKIRKQILYGKPAAELLRKAAKWKPDLIVVGSHGRGAIGRFFLGSVSQKVVEGADCSVRVVPKRSGNDRSPTKIIAGANSLSAAEEAVRAIGRRVWSGETEASLVIVDDGFSAGRVSAVYPYAAAIFEQSADELRAAGLKVSVTVKSGNLKSVLLEEAKSRKADAVFVAAPGSYNESDLDELATDLITGAKCAVEIVR